MLGVTAGGISTIAQWPANAQSALGGAPPSQSGSAGTSN
jgi:hypothetical protein